MALTIAPFPYHQFFDNNGDPAASYQLFTYEAGTTTKLATYSDSAGSTANANPIVLDSAGRAKIFLSPLTYKFVLADSTETDPPASPEWTIDNVSATPEINVDLDISGTAGEALSAGDCVYLSAGDGSRTAGRWYKADADNDYSSSTADGLGFAIAAIASGASGTIRRGGRVTGLAGLSAGTLYYISATAGSITSSAPANKRAVGVADSSTSVVFLQSEVPNVWTNLPDASATVDGIVTTGTQTLAGDKTLSGTTTFSGTTVGAAAYSLCDATLTKNANTTLANVSGLSFAVGASEVWSFQFVLRGQTSTAADYKFALTGPSSPTAVWYGFGATPAYGGVSNATSFGSAISVPNLGTGGVEQMLWCNGLLRNGANAGTVQLQFAQDTSDATDSKILVESYVVAWRHS